MIQAVVFDFDGLLIDTETPWYRVWAEVFEERGQELPLELYGRILGTTDAAFDLLGYLEECTGIPVDRQATYQRMRDRHTELMKREQLRPGVLDYLKQAQELGLKIGLASSSQREWVERHLRANHIFEYFNVIRTSDDVQKVKPDPELYLSALNALGVEPQHAVAFEDSPNGSRAAKAAGMNLVIVPNTLSSTMAFDAYDLRINSMAEMRLQDVLANLNQK
ncbi:MAG: HAD family hydrolase [Tumebacillaceae bacterium]